VIFPAYISKEAKTVSEHSLTLVDRKKIQMSGIKHVNNFDEDEVILETSLGFLLIAGSELHVSMLNLEEGKVNLEGQINSIEYKEPGADLKSKGKSILGRLLK